MLSTQHLSTLNVAGFLIVVLCLSWLIRTVNHPLRKIPGPFLARFSRLWELYEVVQGRFERTNVELHKKYGNFDSSPGKDQLDANVAILP
jgi:uncharacterized membrane protein